MKYQKNDILVLENPSTEFKTRFKIVNVRKGTRGGEEYYLYDIKFIDLNDKKTFYAISEELISLGVLEEYD